VTRLRRRSFAVLLAIGVTTAACSDGRSVEAFCEQAAGLLDADELVGEINVTDSPARAAALDRVATRFDRVVDVAPEEVRADAAVLAEFMHFLVTAVETADPTDPFGQAAGLSKAQAEVGDIEGPSTRYTRYVSRNCAPIPAPG
jgi:hypothetical protein